MRLLLALPLLAGCDVFSKECTLIGCVDTLTVHVVSGDEPVPAFAGEITVDGTTFAVDCTDGATPVDGVYCGDDDGVVTLHGAHGDGEITWSLATPVSEDTGAPRANGSGTATPAWDGDEINGEGCGVCWSGEVTLELFESP